MRIINRKGEVRYNPSAVIQPDENPPLDYHFSSSYPALRVVGSLRAYVFTNGRLLVENEDEANELRALATPGMFSYDGHSLRTGR